MLEELLRDLHLLPLTTGIPTPSMTDDSEALKHLRRFCSSEIIYAHTAVSPTTSSETF